MVTLLLDTGLRLSEMIHLMLFNVHLEEGYCKVEGKGAKEVAQALCVSVNTVKTHLRNIYAKLGVRNRREAAAQAKQLGLVA